MRDHWRPVVLLFAVGLVLLAGCEQKGPAEKAGQKIDKAVEDIGKKVKDASK
jgi:TATA-box binding protein (TBP) (component of TFIID and TFIIIB)